MKKNPANHNSKNTSGVNLAGKKIQLEILRIQRKLVSPKRKCLKNKTWLDVLDSLSWQCPFKFADSYFAAVSNATVFFLSVLSSESSSIPKDLYSLFCLEPRSLRKSRPYCSSLCRVLCCSSSSWRWVWSALVRRISWSSSLRKTRFSVLILCVWSSKHCFASCKKHGLLIWNRSV